MIVLGIETSCDETGIALYDSNNDDDSNNGILSDAIFSQIDLHSQYGGVVPELASRDHIRKIIPLIDEVINKANISPKSIDAIAYTAGPGLMGALLVGAAVAKALAWSWKIPSLEIHHMEGHLLAPMLAKKKPEFPFLALLVSGGHTMLVDVKAFGQYHIIGESLDDAVGEAFDKTAKLLEIGYPGGPAISKLALLGDSNIYQFPRPMTNRPGLDMSFSGLKTFVLNTWNESDRSEKTKTNIAASFQDAVVDTLLIKCKRALKQTGYNTLIVAGGVSANQQLREALVNYGEENQININFPPINLCTDNGAMIAYAGSQRLQSNFSSRDSFQTHARWSLEEI